MRCARCIWWTCSPNTLLTKKQISFWQILPFKPGWDQSLFLLTPRGRNNNLPNPFLVFVARRKETENTVVAPQQSAKSLMREKKNPWFIFKALASRHVQGLWRLGSEWRWQHISDAVARTAACRGRSFYECSQGFFFLQSRCERVMPSLWLIKHVGMIDLSQLLYITEILCPLMNYWGKRVEVRDGKKWKQHHKQGVHACCCCCWQINIIPTHLAPLASTQWGRTESRKS